MSGPRRTLLMSVVLGGLMLSACAPSGSPARVGDPLPPWTAGTLEIHQIVTGRGNSSLMIFPDGTSALVDAGDNGETEFADQRPNASRTPGQWIARYVRQMLSRVDLVGPPRLDYALLTHYHGDHIGRVFGNEMESEADGYLLRGITQVAEDIPIARLIDRGYSYLPPPNDPTFRNYRSFTQMQSRENKMTVAAAEAGSVTQVKPIRRPSAAPDFEVRIIAVNDRVWTGKENETKIRFPRLDTIKAEDDRPTENMCSIAIRLRYGAFDYFTGGDIPGYPVPGGPSWHDVETDIARAIGPTDVHVVNHHGSLEEENPFWLATLKSRVMIVPAWSAMHPSGDVLKRMLSRRVYPEPRDIFVTVLRRETKAALGMRADELASTHGHVVVRVEPGGARYWVLVLDDTRESFRILSVHGPYSSVR